MISTFTAFFDANVFYGARLRSLIMELSQTGLFRSRWSGDVHREWMNNLLSNRPDLRLEDLESTRKSMDESVLDAVVTGYDRLIQSLELPDPNDRHILAAALVGKASIIVTFNLKHFPAETIGEFGICPKHPDDFLLDVESLNTGEFIDAVVRDIGHYKKPPVTVDEYLRSLDKAGVPRTAEFLRQRKVLLDPDDA